VYLYVTNCCCLYAVWIRTVQQLQMYVFWAICGEKCCLVAISWCSRYWIVINISIIHMRVFIWSRVDVPVNCIDFFLCLLLFIIFMVSFILSYIYTVSDAWWEYRPTKHIRNSHTVPFQLHMDNTISSIHISIINKTRDLYRY
jgi:hypothetical protein